MAISVQANQSGTKTLTTGTTLTIALNSTAGDAIYVAILATSTTLNAQSCSDGGGNVYDRVNHRAGTTQDIALFKSRSTTPAASGTITVTITTGSTAVGVAVSLRGVGWAGDASPTGTNANSGTITTGAITLPDANDWVIGAFGSTNAGALTATSGTIEVQQTITGGRVGILTSRGSASPATLTATHTSSAWSQVNLVLRPMDMMVDSINNWQDSEGDNFHLGQSLSDTMTLTDEPLSVTTTQIGLDIQCPHASTNWADSALAQITLAQSATDTMTLTDGTATQQGEYGLAIFEGAGQGNWADSVTTFVPSTAQLTEALADALTLSDSLLLGYGQLSADTLTLQDSLLLGFGDLVADQLTLTDAVLSLLAVGLGLTDTLTLSDTLAIGYGDLIADQTTQTDSLLVGYGNRVSDQLTQTDTLQLAMVLSEILTDTLTLTDSLALGYGNSVRETLSMLDALAIGYGQGQVDTITFSDSSSVGYGDLIADALTLSDTLAVVLSVTFALADTLTQTDRLAIGYGDQITEALSLSDSASSGVGNTVSDTLTLSDQLRIGYGDLIADALTLTDAFALNSGAALINESLSDALTLADQLRLGYGSAVTDTMSLSDALSTVGGGDALADTMTMTELVMICLIGTELDEDVADTFTITDGTGDPLGEWSFTIRDSMALMMADAALVQLALPTALFEVLSDAMTLTDSQMLGYGMLPTESLTLVDRLALGYGNLVADTMTLSDTLATVLGLLKSLTDTMVLTDSLSALMSAAATLSDTMVMSDSQTIGYGQATSDTLTQLDSNVIGYGGQLADSMTMADVFSFNAGQPGLQQSLSDALTQSDTLAIGYGAGVADLWLAQTEQDTFQRPDENPLDPTQWTNISFPMKLVSNQAVAADGVNIDSAVQIGTFPDEQWSEVTFGASASAQSASVIIQGQNSGSGITGYVTSLNQQAGGLGVVGGATLSLIRTVNGVNTTLGSLAGLTVNVGDRLGIARIGTKFFLLLNGRSIMVRDDAANVFSGGAPGFFFRTGPKIAAWSGGQIAMADQVLIGFGQAVSDTVTFSDSAQVGLENKLSANDTLVMADTAMSGFGLLIAEQLIWTDQFISSLAGGGIQQIEDVLSMLDSMAALMTLTSLASDQMVQSDSNQLGYGNAVKDQLVLTDSALESLSIAKLLSDTLTMSDTLSGMGFGSAASDSLVLSDSQTIGVGQSLVEQLLLLDGSALGFGLLVADSLNTWLDALTFTTGQPGLTVLVSDTLSMTDSSMMGYGNSVKDTSSMTDQMSLVESFQLLLVDASPLQLDALKTLLTFGLACQDQVVFTEQLATLYGLIMAEQMTLTDSLNPQLIGPLSLILADAEVATWFDQVLTLMVFAPGEVVIAAIHVLNEMVAEKLTVRGQQEVSNIVVEVED